MAVDKITIYNLKIPFSRTIKHRLYTRIETKSIVVVIQDSGGNQGVGEGTPREYVTGETLEKCQKAARLNSEAILDQPYGSKAKIDLLENQGCRSGKRAGTVSHRTGDDHCRRIHVHVQRTLLSDRQRCLPWPQHSIVQLWGGAGRIRFISGRGQSR